MYYWGEFQKALKLYAELKKQSDSLNAFNLGRWIPIRNNLGFDYDYNYMIDEIVKNIKEGCDNENIQHPDIFYRIWKIHRWRKWGYNFEVLGAKKAK